MHPDLAELLSLRDRPLAGADAPASPAALHLSECAPCRLEFERLQRLRVAMRNAPAPSGAERLPEHGWSAVSARFARREPQLAWPRPGWRMAGGLAGALMIAVGLAFFSGRTTHREELTQAVVSPSAADAVPAGDRVAALMAESQRLESLLAALPSEPTVARAGTVFTAAGLEDRIEWIDYALGERSVRQADSARAQPLWQQRVDLLNSLVAVRYAQVRTVSLSF
jgi:hypothetical protein